MARDQKMNRRRELGKTYSYKPDPFSEGTREYYEEQLTRAGKNTSHKTRISEWKSVMAKLNYRLAKEKEERVKMAKKLINEG